METQTGRPSAKRRVMEETKQNISNLQGRYEKKAEALEARYEKYRTILQNLTIMSDMFMRNVLKKKECTEYILQTILKEEIQVLDQTLQKDFKNLQGRSAILDCLARDNQNRRMNVEIQKEKEGASPKRARYHSGLIDMNTLEPGQDFGELPENYVIFITRTDVLGRKKQIYHIDRRIRETGEVFDDNTYIVYVNAEVQDDTEIGKLVHDLHCKNAEDMYSEVLTQRVRELKETEEGRNIMCREMEEIYNWGIEHERKNTELEKQKAEQEKQKAEQEKQNIARLTTVLLENGYVEECLRAANDEAYQRQLMKEWNIA